MLLLILRTHAADAAHMFVYDFRIAAVADMAHAGNVDVQLLAGIDIDARGAVDVDARFLSAQIARIDLAGA